MAQHPGDEHEQDREAFLVALLEQEEREEQAAIDREEDRLLRELERERWPHPNRIHDERWRA